MWWVFAIALAFAAVFLFIAALSDRRDRQSGFDPKVRGESVMANRRRIKDELYKSRARRLGAIDPDDDPRHRHR
ncbi:MAG: hypothetical protein JO291_16435 [Acidimicrobiia bacterium]|nr:hypothetical protein [Acidimicrobiia bacterium]